MVKVNAGKSAPRRKGALLLFAGMFDDAVGGEKKTRHREPREGAASDDGPC